MASEKNKPNVVNYEMMPDRGLTHPDEESEFAPGDELQLNIQDWKPHLVAHDPTGPSWMDPKKDPRFGKEKKSDYVGDDAAIDLNYDFTKPREGVHVLNMKNLPNRWIDPSEENQILHKELLGNDEVERRWQRVQDASEEDHMIRIGEEMQSKKKRSSSYVNMKQQPTRPVNINKTDAPDAEYEINDANKERRDVGVRNWDMVPGRELRIITKEKNQFNAIERESDDEEVDISPESAALSRSVSEFELLISDSHATV
jgi:hypothetical protein